jgi:hypothetical protein
MGLADSVKNAYFAAEDQYYVVLDKVQKKIPVYSVIDPLDKILPSFGIVLALVVAILGLGLFTGLLGILSGGEKVDLTVTFNDDAGSSVSGVLVSLEKDGKIIDSQTTKTNGRVVVSASPGKYDLRGIKDGYVSFFQAIELTQDKSQIFTLNELVSPAKQRALLIQDTSGNVLGVLSSVSISLSFSCQSGVPPANQTSASGNVTFLQPGNCLGLSVTISASSFVSKTIPISNDSTIISLQSAASFTPDPVSSNGGTVEVVVKGPSSSLVDQAQIKLYKVPAAGSNVLVSQTLSDPNGLGIFQDVSPGMHVVVVAKSGFKQTTSAAFQVNAGETTAQTITLPASSNTKKLFVKILSSLNQLPVSGANVTLFVQGAAGNMMEYDSYTSDSNGTVSQLLADFNGSTTLVVSHDNYVIDISSNVGIVSEEQSAPVPILLDPLSAPASNGSISNALVINVKVTDEVNLAINQADVRLHTPDLNGVTLSVRQTNSQGIANFSNLPAGEYQAAVSTALADGNSSILNGAVGQVLTLPVTVTLGNALIKVVVKDELNTLVSDANVSIFSVPGNVLQAKGTTNAQGVVQLGVSTGQQVFVRVDKSPYLPFLSVPFDVLKDNTHTINIEVSLTNPSQPADVSLTRIDQISSTGAAVLANSLANGGLYAFHFTVKSSTTQNNLKSVVRVNADNSSPHNPTLDVGSVLGAQAAKGGLAFFSVNNPTAPFSPSSPVDSNTLSKVVVNTLGDVNGASSYEFIVFVKIRPVPSPVPPVADTLELRFQAQSDSALNTTSYFETFTIGQPLNQSNFSFVFFISGGTFSSPAQINGGYPIVIEKDVDYTVDYQISNTSGTSPANAILQLNKDAASLTPTPSSISLANFTNNSSATGSFTLRSTLACGGPPLSSTSYCATLSPTITGTSTVPAPVFPIRVFTTPSKALFLSPTPSFLIPGQSNQLVQVVVRDQLGVLATAANGVSLSGTVKDAGGTVLVDSFAFTASGNYFVGTIPSSPDGSFLEIKATASGYADGLVNVPISSQILLNYSTDFSCVTFTPSSSPFSFVKGGQATLNVRAQNCQGDISFYTGGFSPAPGITYELTVKNAQGSVVSNTNPVTLVNGNSTSLTVSLPSGPFGQYPLYVYAKFAGQSSSSYSLVTNIDTFVQPLGGASGNCLNLSKYVFDISDGADAAQIVNNCNPLVHDVFMPSVTLPVSGVYGHALPSVLTPEMQNPGAPISFSYNVGVDYNNTFNSDVNIEDFTQDPPILDGNWSRYAINFASATGAQFYSNRDDYVDPFFNTPKSGVVHTLIPDAQFYGSADNKFFYLETSDDPAYFPWASPLSVRSVMFESTFILDRAATVDQLCFTSDHLHNMVVKIDGKVVQTTLNTDCDPSLNKYYFSPGPHSIQIFLYKGGVSNDYWVRVQYKDLPFTNNTKCFKDSSNQTVCSDYAPLSNGRGRGFFLSPAYGIPFSTENKTNGTFSLSANGVSANIVPSTAQNYSASSVGNLSASVSGNDILSILSNKGGIDHLKQVYVNTSTNNPSVRAFLHGDEIRSQYVGFDSPSSQQNVVFENISSAGEKYGLVKLEDYSTGSPSAGGVVDVGVLVDASASMLLNERDENSHFIGGTIQQTGLCSFLANVKSEIEYYSGATVNFRFVLMGDVKHFYVPAGKNPSINPCAGSYSLNDDTFAGYLEGMHDVNEAWAFAAEKFAKNNYSSSSVSPFWQNDAKLMIVLTDNKPSGLGTSARASDWDPVLETTLSTHAGNVLSTQNIKGVVLYKTPLESTAISSSTNQSLVLQSYDTFASLSNGFVEAWENSEIINTSNSFVWEHAQNNKIGVRLAQALFSRDTEYALVKLVSLPASACVSESGDIGQTGAGAFPKLAYDWRWTSYQANPRVCDFNASSPFDVHYCDSAQFMMTLVEKWEALENAYRSTATSTQVASIPSLTTFDTYLMYDALSTDFREDFVDYYTNIDFAQTPPYFKPAVGNMEGVWKDYLLSPDRVSFVMDNDPNATVIPTPGLYRVHVGVEWDGLSGEFFTASSPSARLTISLTPLADAQNMSHYSEFLELPLDGRVGYDSTSQEFHRQGYGTAFTGEVVDLVSYSSLSLQTHPNAPGNTALNTYHVPSLPGAVELNTQSRGELFTLDKASGTLSIRPSLPAPLAMEWSSNVLGSGDAFYGIGETTPTNGNPAYLSSSSNNLLQWTPYGSIKKQPTLSCAGNQCAICVDGGSNPFVASVAYDATPSSASCGLRAPLSASTAFGFTSTGSADNSAYLATLFYRVPENTYTIVQGCNSPAPNHGRIFTANGMVDDSNPSTQIDLGLVENTLAQNDSLSDWLNLTGSAYTCVSTSNGKTKLYWNAKKIREDFTASSFTSQGFGTVSNAACTATGSPFGVAGTFTLNERTDSVYANASTPPAGFLGFCPLYNSNDSPNGYFGQYGVPYPVGTKIFFPSIGAITQDPADGFVQYRFNPTQCTTLSTIDCPASPGKTAFDYCPQNTERYWEGVPFINP